MLKYFDKIKLQPHKKKLQAANITRPSQNSKSAHHLLASRSSSPVKNVETGYSLNSDSAKVRRVSGRRVSGPVAAFLPGSGMYGTTRRTVIWEPAATLGTMNDCIVLLAE